MLKQTFQDMISVSLGRDEDLRSLSSIKDIKIAGISFLITMVSLFLIRLANLYAKNSFISQYSPNFAATFEQGINLQFFTYLLLFYIVLWVFFTLVVHSSAYILGARQSVIPTFIIIGLSSPYFILVSLIPTCLYLTFNIPIIPLVLILAPVVLFLLWLRILYKIGKQTYSFSNQRATAIVLIVVSSLSILWILFYFMLSPFRYII